MDFKLTKAQLLQQELFRNFAETEIKPIAKDMDEAEEYSQELVQKLQKIGAFRYSLLQRVWRTGELMC